MNDTENLTKIKQIFSGLFAGYGYSEVTIPLFADALLYEKYKGVPDNKYIKFIDRHGSVQVIRPDATFHILKKVSSMGVRRVQKLCYTTEIVRAAAGSYSQMVQSGIEYFNDPTPMCDAEVIALGVMALDALGVSDIRVDVGHSEFVRAMLLGVDKLSKNDIAQCQTYISGKNAVDLELLLSARGLSAHTIERICGVCMLFGDYESVMASAAGLVENAKMESALRELADIYSCLCAYGLSDKIYLDMGFSNAMDYYSGMIFKVYAKSAGSEIIGGGRYDSLASRFGSRRHACGFGANLNLIAPLADRSFTREADIVHITSDQAGYAEAIAQAKELRKAGLAVSLSGGAEKMKYYYKNKSYGDFSSLIAAAENKND